MDIKILLYSKCPVPNRFFGKKRIKGGSNGSKDLDKLTVVTYNIKEGMELGTGSWGSK